MSCSKITDKADEEPEDEEANETLVVVVKPDGTVAIDQETFNRVLEKKKETMNIIHFENSSNKGITTNPENGEPEINLTVQGFYPSISTKTFLSQVASCGGELDPGLLDMSAEQLEQLESSLSCDILKIFGQDESNILDILPNENDMSKNPIYLDHCYYKDYPTNSSDNNKIDLTFQDSLTSKIQQITSKLTQSQLVNNIEEIEEITVSVAESKLQSDPTSLLVEDIKSNVPTTTSHNLLQSNLSNTKKIQNLRVGKNEKSKTKDPVFPRNESTKKKPDEIRNNQSNDSPRPSKTVKRLLPLTAFDIVWTIETFDSQCSSTSTTTLPPLLAVSLPSVVSAVTVPSLLPVCTSTEASGATTTVSVHRTICRRRRNVFVTTSHRIRLDMSSLTFMMVLATLSAYVCYTNAYSSENLSCPVECECYLFRINWVTDCSESNLTYIPTEELDNNVYVLNMNRNLLRDIDPFPANIKLRTLQLSENTLTKIAKTSFAGLTYLLDIDLSSNFINYIHPESFVNNAGLITLELQRNPLDQVVGPFLHSKSLLNLYLANSNLMTLTPQFFTNISSLNKLDLSGNPLRRIESGVFDPLTGLKHLILNNCELTHISNAAFRRLKELTKLELSGNSFVTVEWTSVLGHLSKLEHLDLRRSGLSNLPKDAFFSNTWLRTLVLAENQLSDLNLFITLGHKLVNLDYLDLSYCDFKEPLYRCAFANANKLRTLILSGNHLSSQDVAKAISPLPKLVKLSLKNCGLTQLPTDIFEHLTDLRELDISRNPLNSVSEALLSPLQSLERLDMGYGNLETISRTTFSKNPALKTLVLSGNKFHGFESGLFQSLARLEVLELNDCELGHLNESVFHGNANYPNLEELRLSGNPIQVPKKGPLLPPQLSGLKKLDLSKCDLTNLPKDAFETTPDVYQLLLNDNKFKCDPLKFLEPLGGLQLLDLSNNDMIEIKPGSFKNNRQISSLKLVGNPLNCDCHVVDMWKWAAESVGNVDVLVGFRRPAVSNVDDKNVKRLTCRFDPRRSPVKETGVKRVEGERSWAKYLREADCPRDTTVATKPTRTYKREIRDQEGPKNNVLWIPYGFYGVVIGTLIVQIVRSHL